MCAYALVVQRRIGIWFLEFGTYRTGHGVLTNFLYNFNLPNSNIMNALTHHLIESANYRFQKVVEEADVNFSSFSLGHDTRTALEIVNHLVNVLALAEATLSETDRVVWHTYNWEQGKQQFKFVINGLLDFLDNNEVEDELMEVMIHGPLSDVFGHIGQLAMMRRVSGKPVGRVNYMKAPVSLRNPNKMKASRASG